MKIKIVLLSVVITTVAIFTNYDFKTKKSDVPQNENKDIYQEQHVATTDSPEPPAFVEKPPKEVASKIEPNGIHQDALDTLARSKAIRERMKERDVKKREKQEYIQSLIREYNIDIHDRIKIEDSLFHDYKSVEVDEYTQDIEIYHKVVVRSPISAEDLFLLVNEGLKRERSYEFSINLPYYNPLGEYRSLTITECSNRYNLIMCDGNNQRAYISKDENVTDFTMEIKVTERREGPESMHVPYTFYMLRENELYMYNQLNQNFKVRTDYTGPRLGDF